MATITSARIDVRLLGGLAVSADGRPLDLAGPKQRALLAYLALHANETVTTERLVDGLWGETPPATAPASLRVTLSKLRRRLAEHGLEGRLVTSPAGYSFRLEPDEVDVLRFASLNALGRAALEEGRARDAADRLGEALALWSGPALADLAYEPFALAAAPRLEEDRLAALEARVDADLALGRHRELVGELEALVATHPLRERFTAQLMLALYRSGRQAEALAAYREARARLVDELGIEPGKGLADLERAILAHDPTLDVDVGPTPTADSPSEPSRRRIRLLLAGASVAAAAAALGLVLTLRGGDDSISAISPNAVGVIDPGSNQLVGEVPVGIRPGPVATGEGSVWVANLDDQTVSRIDPESREVVRTIPAGGFPTDVAVDGGSVWVLLPEQLELARISPEFDEVEHRPLRGFGEVRCDINSVLSRIAVDGGRAWVTCSTIFPARVDLRTGRSELTPRETLASPDPFYNEDFDDIAVGLGSAWVINRAINAITRIEPDTNTGQGPQSITVGRSPYAIAVGDGSLWVANREDDTVSRVDVPLGKPPIVTPIAVGDGPVDVAYGEDAVWVANSLEGTISRIDPETNDVVATVRVGGKPQRVTAGEGAVWVTLEPRLATE